MTGRSTLDGPPLLQTTWNDPVTGRRGYVVIDTLVRGVAGGGLRMRRGCSLAEVTDLARAMTRKEAVTYMPGQRYVPMGGAKGGVDCDPRAPEARGVLKRFVDGTRALLQHHWATGEDLGVRQDVLDEIVAEVGLTSSVQAALPLVENPHAGLQRIAAAFGVTVDGLGLGDVVGGAGVARAALTALGARGRDPGGATAVVQGFGSMGGGTAWALAREGVRVVAIADAEGVVANPEGLDVQALLAGRDAFGTVDRAGLRPSDACLPSGLWLDFDADVLVPAAVSYVLDGGNADRVRAELVVEAANVATSAEAEAALASRGVDVLPDFVANSAANAWWWWTLFGDVEPTAEAALSHIDAHMHLLTSRVLSKARREGTSLRAAATAVAASNLETLQAAA